MLKRASKDAIKELKKARWVKTDDDKTVTYEDVNIDDVSTVGYNSDTENMATTLAISSSQQQPKKIINARESKDDDVVFLKQVLLHPRQRLARMNKQDEKDVEFIVSRLCFTPDEGC